ncbi:hypothetical protein, partial [Undibacterium crateris]|uniref:hypothetical protein n=1 Tax=Undibacterium crateris TaxID=2528175 RepID=UPI001F209D5F
MKNISFNFGSSTCLTIGLLISLSFSNIAMAQSSLDVSDSGKAKVFFVSPQNNVIVRVNLPQSVPGIT